MKSKSYQMDPPPSKTFEAIDPIKHTELMKQLTPTLRKFYRILSVDSSKEMIQFMLRLLKWSLKYV